MCIDSVYTHREQTEVKHFLLRRYLAAFARILGRYHDIAYIDCCSGPWQNVDEGFKDTSFGIAVEQLRAAKNYLAASGKTVSIRCLFLEKRLSSYAVLKGFCEATTDVEARALNADFTASIDQIVDFINERPNTFPFIFIDPTGWTPIRIASVLPLLRLKPGEVLINFMTSHIRRFLEQDDLDFDSLFGAEYMERLRGLSGQERDDMAAFSYADAVRNAGDFPYVCTAVVLNPLIDRTHFHLIYATRNLKGVDVFKQTEKTAAGLMRTTRAAAQLRARMERTGQAEMFGTDVVHDDSYQETLRRAYVMKAEDMLAARLMSCRFLDYDAAWQIASQFPLVWESDLKEWIRSLGSRVQVVGLAPNQRVPHLKQNIRLCWNGG